MTNWTSGQCVLWAAGVYGAILSVVAFYSGGFAWGAQATGAIAATTATVAGAVVLIPRLVRAALPYAPRAVPLLRNAALFSAGATIAGMVLIFVPLTAAPPAQQSVVLIEDAHAAPQARFTATCVRYYAGNPASHDPRYAPSCFEVLVIFANGYRDVMYALDSPETDEPENLRTLGLGETRTVY